MQFLVSVRNGDPTKVGYIASGFWTGFTLGRVALADITHRLGERRMVFVYTALAVAMQLLFWLVPDITINAVTVCFLGEYAPFQRKRETKYAAVKNTANTRHQVSLSVLSTQLDFTSSPRSSQRSFTWEQWVSSWNLSVDLLMLIINRIHCQSWTGRVRCISFPYGSGSLPGRRPGVAAHHAGAAHWDCLFLVLGP